MRAGRIRALVVVSSGLLLAGCAVGRFIAGAPAAGAVAPEHALLVRRCGGCHEVPDPTRMSAEAWSGSLERMKRRMTLPSNEWDSLAAMGRR